MQSFSELSASFEQYFNKRHFPAQPAELYDAGQYILGIGGKRVRPVMVLMGNQLFDEIKEEAWHLATAVELFHNFSLVHDDIMDKAPLRRGRETVHHKYGESSALLAGDVMLVTAYEYINKLPSELIHKIITLFNKTAKEVCEGQQIDMNFENKEKVSLDEYVEMITLKTSVLLASSLQMGAVLGGAGLGNQQHLYEFGKNLGIAFQVQDDYLDAFGDPEKFGKQVGGDILANKKTFLMIHAMEACNEQQKKELIGLMNIDQSSKESQKSKIDKVLQIFRGCGSDQWADSLKEQYFQKALYHLEEIAVLSKRKTHLHELAGSLLKRES